MLTCESPHALSDLDQRGKSGFGIASPRGREAEGSAGVERAGRLAERTAARAVALDRGIGGEGGGEQPLRIGVASIGEIHVLALHARDGVEGVITGRALYDGRLDLAAALSVAAAA